MTSFEEGEIAYVRDYRNPQKPSWTKAVIVSKLGLENYLCRPVDNARLEWRRHLDQIIKVGSFYTNENSGILKKDFSENVSSNSNSENSQIETTSPTNLSRFNRQIKAPDRLNL
ncbi:hypothetical protein JTB14_003243 [Gonioctena quinquepunctata]|nr:hypothetical protein JTB14_003243 [Gonioctena quinquepunctata]